MPTLSKTAAQGPMSRAEKLSILSAMLGPDAMARLRDGQSEAPTEFSNAPVEVDAERAAWQRNRLLERLRQQGGQKSLSASPTPETDGAARARAEAQGNRQWRPENAHLDARLARISDFSTLGQEHPAIIARLVKALSREERVEALKSLPGPMARSIVRRLR